MKSIVAIGLTASFLAAPVYAIPPKGFGKKPAQSTTPVAEPGAQKLKESFEANNQPSASKPKKPQKPSVLKKN